MLLSFSIINTCNHLCRVEARTAWKGNFEFCLWTFLFSPPRPSSWLSRFRDPGSMLLRGWFSNFSKCGASLARSPDRFRLNCALESGMACWTGRGVSPPALHLHCGSQGFSVLVIGADCVPVVVCFSDKYSIWVWVKFTVQKQTFILCEEPWALFLYFPKQCFQ